MPLSTEKAKAAGRLGGLKKKGKRLPATLEKEKVLKELKLRIMRNSDSLFNAAKSSAVGNQYLYKIRTYYEGKKKVRSKPMIVTDPIEIADYIDRLDRENRGEEVESEDSDVYYFMTTREPNHHAIRDLLDRAFGKPKETIEATVKLPTPLLNVIRNNNGNGETV